MEETLDYAQGVSCWHALAETLAFKMKTYPVFIFWPEGHMARLLDLLAYPKNERRIERWRNFGPKLSSEKLLMLSFGLRSSTPSNQSQRLQLT
jgi:hypothetical protein